MPRHQIVRRCFVREKRIYTSPRGAREFRQRADQRKRHLVLLEIIARRLACRRRILRVIEEVVRDLKREAQSPTIACQRLAMAQRAEQRACLARGRKQRCV